MKNPVYISGLGSVSAQRSFEKAQFLEDITYYEATEISAIDPNYKEFIPPAAARRMAKGIKMGSVASKLALEDANIDQVDGIITGTGMGCLIESEKFVSGIIDNQEQYLTPTAFIQSTHNTVGGQIALGMGCKGYNFTYVHASTSFEAALMDSLLQIGSGEAQNMLVGGVDELASHSLEMHKAIGYVKQSPTKTQNLLTSGTPGTIFGEGANFFVVTSEKASEAYAQIVDIKTYNNLPHSDLEESVVAFLNRNKLDLSTVDLVILGNNGDSEYDSYYGLLSQGIFQNIPQAYYKHLSGEFYTASSFGLWLACKVIRNQTLPKETALNQIFPKKFDHILLYNQYRGENHSLCLLKGC